MSSKRPLDPKPFISFGEVETRETRLLLKSEIKSMRNLMAYFVDVFQRPWPLVDSSCFKDVEVAGEILFRLFVLQEPGFTKNRFEILQLHSPIDFRGRHVFGPFNPSIHGC